MVDVDVETGKVILPRLIAVDDCGRILNPLIAEGRCMAASRKAVVVDALAHLGVRHIEMPTTPQRVWTAINDTLYRYASSIDRKD